MSFWKTWFGGAAAAPVKREGPAWDALRGVEDPELGLDVVALGMVRRLEPPEPRPGEALHVVMTLSTRGCPVGPAIVADAVEKLAAAGFPAEVELEFDPPWDPSDMEEGARTRLRGG